jgi:hypothetical protein
MPAGKSGQLMLQRWVRSWPLPSSERQVPQLRRPAQRKPHKRHRLEAGVPETEGGRHLALFERNRENKNLLTDLPVPHERDSPAAVRGTKGSRPEGDFPVSGSLGT